MTYIATVTQKGQVTIPAAVRALLGVKPYEKVSFSLKNNVVVLKSSKDFLSLRGSVKEKIRYTDDAVDQLVLRHVKKTYGKKAADR